MAPSFLAACFGLSSSASPVVKQQQQLVNHASPSPPNSENPPTASSSEAHRQQQPNNNNTLWESSQVCWAVLHHPHNGEPSTVSMMAKCPQHPHTLSPDALCQQTTSVTKPTLQPCLLPTSPPPQVDQWQASLLQLSQVSGSAIKKLQTSAAILLRLMPHGLVV